MLIKKSKYEALEKEFSNFKHNAKINEGVLKSVKDSYKDEAIRLREENSELDLKLARCRQKLNHMFDFSLTLQREKQELSEALSDADKTIEQYEKVINRLEEEKRLMQRATKQALNEQYGIRVKI